MAKLCAVLIFGFALAACGGSTNQKADLTHGVSAELSTSDYGVPRDKREQAAMAKELSTYFGSQRAQSVGGLMGESVTGARPKASGFLPKAAYRFFNTLTGVHFYTLSEEERALVLEKFKQFQYEGPAFFAVPNAVDNLQPVYRFYNKVSGTHFYTISIAEKNDVIQRFSDIFTFEGISWYGSASGGPGWRPIYRFFNTVTGTHFYSANPAERDSVRSNLPQYVYEGVGYFVRLTESLDPGVAGVDANGNGVRDSLEQVLSRLVPDALGLDRNLRVAAAYQRLLENPLPSTQEQVATDLKSLICSELAAGDSLFESSENGLIGVVFDTDVRYAKYADFLSLSGGAYAGSEIGSCTLGKSFRVFEGRKALGDGISEVGVNTLNSRPKRVVYLNGVFNSDYDAAKSSQDLSQALGFNEKQGDFDFDYIHVPSDGLGVGDLSEVVMQASLSAVVLRSLPLGLNGVNADWHQKAEYYYQLGRAYQGGSGTIPFRMKEATAKIAGYIRKKIDQNEVDELIFVAHSQGNLYIEAALAQLVMQIRDGAWTSLTLDDLRRKVRVVGVAPASATTWSDLYLSSQADRVIGGLRARGDLVSFRALEGNFNFCGADSLVNMCAGKMGGVEATYFWNLGVDWLYHSFAGVFLNSRLSLEPGVGLGQAAPGAIVRGAMVQMINGAISQSATARLPHSGVTGLECYRAGGNALVDCSGSEALSLNSRQDGHRVSVNPMSFHVIPGRTLAECVVDNVTGLVWEGKLADGSLRDYHFSYSNLNNLQNDDASAYVVAVNSQGLCGYTDWRIPGADELASIVDHGRGGIQALSTAWFPNSFGDYWSSSGGRDGKKVVMGTLNGARNLKLATEFHQLRLVRGARWAGHRFSFASIPIGGDSSSNVVVDAKTGLQWRRCSEGQVWSGMTCTGTPTPYGHEAALAHVQMISGWRLPNVKELSSLFAWEQSSGSYIDPTVFPATAADYWTSTPEGNPTGNYAWMLSVGVGHVNFGFRSSSYAVRLVRNIQ